MWTSTGHFLWLVFDLPAGGIWANLIASLLWVGITIAYIKITQTKLIDNLDGKLDHKLSLHHEKLVKHINDKMDEANAS